MSSLADLPDLIGFFSYSREDDQGSRGALSALRDAIQGELSAQLGRTRTDFRVWQDKAAISLGTLWEKQITQGIKQAVFFIPIVTPRALKSQHCAFEFQSFLAREAELGRDDLVFPILYIPVPALEDERLWRDDPVLKIVGTRQYLDWRDLRHHEANSTEVRQKLERFCRNITNALQRQWLPLEELRRREEAEARQKTEEHQRRKAAEIEAERSAQEERRRREADSARRAEEEGHARIAEPQRGRRQPRPAIIIPGAVAAVAIVAAIVVWAESKPSPSNQQASAVSTMPLLPTSPSASPAAQRATALVPSPQVTADTSSKPTPAPSFAPIPSADEVAWSFLKDTTDDAALKRFTAQYPDSPLRKDAEARIAALTAAQAAKPAAPSPEQSAWDLVKDSKDPDQLRQFVERFPNSAQRADAEQRIASLSVESLKAATANAPEPHELTRSLQLELQRVGCFKGDVNGLFDDDTKVAWHRFIKLTSISMPDDVSSDAIKAVRGINKRVCPLICPHGEHAENELCVGNAPPPKRATTKAATAREPTLPTAAPPAKGTCFGTLAGSSGSAMSRQECQ